jgi:hypothetical protein
MNYIIKLSFERSRLEQRTHIVERLSEISIFETTVNFHVAMSTTSLQWTLDTPALLMKLLIGLVNWNLKVLFSIIALSYSRSIVLGLGKQYSVFEQFISLEK